MGKNIPQSGGARHQARVFVLLGLYQWLTDPTLDFAGIEAHLKDLIHEEGAQLEDCDIDPADFDRCDKPLFDELLSGVLDNKDELLATVTRFVDRDFNRVSLVERAVLLLGTYELMKCPQTPWRVVINESVELAKRFGSGYRFTNGVLEQVAKDVRPDEVASL